ncbi:SH3 domain-containing protein [Pseudomonas sp.]|uniref:SH3 domain-containing protein n=1 Tax=Pseudomonas sp. TaxID=306 RepID=UPI003BB08B1E
MKFIALSSHRNEYPEPITLAKGDLLAIGERYSGDEGWDNWYFCTTPGQLGGWVPDQVLERLDEGHGRALEDYCARELEVDPGDRLEGGRQLNGWVWCCRTRDGVAGWVPLAVVQRVD